MWQRIETTGIFIGLLGASILLVVIFYWPSFPKAVHQLFYGGELGAFVTGVFIIIGILSSLLFLANLAFKRFTLWWVRLLSIIVFYFGIVVIGASGI